MSSVPRNPGAGKAGGRDGGLVLRAEEEGSAWRGAGPKLFNRDLSWLEFNRRVLAQAADPRVPLLERVKFLAIFTSNLDEFFMKRVGLLKRLVATGNDSRSPDGLVPSEQLSLAREMALALQLEQARIYTQDVSPALAREGIHILRHEDLSRKEQTWLREWFMTHVFAALTPLTVDPGHRFPFISNLSENLGLLGSLPGATDASGQPKVQFARVKIPSHAIRRYVSMPQPTGSREVRLLSLDELIKANLGALFPGVKIHTRAHFRVTRSAGVQRDPVPGRELGDLLESVEADLKQRRFARPVRLEIEPDAHPRIRAELLDRLRLDEADVYELPGLIEYNELMEISELDRPELKDKPWRGVIPKRLTGPAGNIFAEIRRSDILVHHPYESFHASVEKFIAAAAADPDVLSIKQTLYRTSRDSPFIESLIRAAESGKQVACLVELRARFDEDRNVRFARQLEKAGVHVAYGVMGLKTHSKTSLVVRRERSGLRCYAHIGTGNYNPKTAQLYTDLGLLTCDPAITADAVTLFNYLTGLSAPQEYGTLLVAPFNMRARFEALIDREIEQAERHRKDPSRHAPGRIVAKFNSLEDVGITQKLYQASAAGVDITLIVRGFCCLRPGVPGLSENIRVISVIGRFLEHSRIFHFGAGHADPLDGEWYISSADWMYRNLNNRVEAAVPVRDPAARQKLSRIVDIMLADRRNAWQLGPDGRYEPRPAPTDADAPIEALEGTFRSLMRDAEQGRPERDA
jgi:polyphosphate kinase